AQIESIFSIFEEAVPTSAYPKEEEKAIIPNASESPSFSFTTRLPSLDVDKSLLERLENFVLKEVPKICSVPTEKLHKEYTVSFFDHSGRHTHRSISHYAPELFPDTVTRVDLKTGHIFCANMRLNLSIRLDR